MSELKIRVTLGNYNIELEGASEDVIAQFTDLKENGLGQIVDQFANITKLTPTELQSINADTQDKLLTSPKDGNNDHSLLDLAVKDIISSETEWIVIYAYYITNEGKTNFTRQDLIKKYEETNRKKQSAIKNLSVYINLNQKYGWLRKLNDTDYILLPTGVSKAQEILGRPTGSAKPAKKQKKSVKNKPAKNSFTDSNEN